MKKDNWKNKLFYGDNLEILRKYIESNSIDLCYIDPPFNSKRNYNQIYLNQGGEDLAQAFIDTWNWGVRAENEYEQIMVNEKSLCSSQLIELIAGLKNVLGKSSLMAYLVSMALRILEIHRVLKSTGSFYLHCDPTASHYLKLILDSIFCAKGGYFINEIIWCYSTGGRAKEFYPRKHDVIFWYVKTNNYIFQYDDIALKRDTSTMHEPVMYDSKGKPYQRNFKNGKEYKYYLNKGVLPNDWWTDIQAINPSAKERLGYPTQKPETLLERMIKSSCPKNGIVLDAYCGCGTTIAVAQRLKRRWIGIDITFQSISLVLERLENSFSNKVLTNIDINGVPKDFESAEALAHKEDDRTRKEFEKWAVLTYTKNRAIIHDQKGKDYGIDGIAYIQDRPDGRTEEIRKIIFSVKSDIKPKPAYVRELIGTMEREKAVFGFLLTLYKPTPDMELEANKTGMYHNKLFDIEFPKVQLITANDIINGERLVIPKNIETKVVKKALKVKDSGVQTTIEM